MPAINTKREILKNKKLAIAAWICFFTIKKNGGKIRSCSFMNKYHMSLVHTTYYHTNDKKRAFNEQIPQH